MNVYFCPVPIEEDRVGNTGRKYLFSHKNDWVDGTNLLEYLSTGYVKGCDYVLLPDNKVYYVKQSIMNPQEGYVVHACVESIVPRDADPNA